MTFRPTSAETSVEAILDNELNGWVFDNIVLQHVQGGVLRLLPDPDSGTQTNLLHPWPKLNWSQRETFPTAPDEITGRWSYTIDGHETGDPRFDSDTDFLLIDTTTGEEYYRQAADEDSGQTHWADNVDADSGWVLEMELQVADGTTGASHYVLMDDGSYRRKLHFYEDRLAFFHWDTGAGAWAYKDWLSPPVDLSTKPRTLRIVGQSYNTQLFLDDGMVMHGAPADDMTGVNSDTTGELIFGTETGADATTIFNKLYQYHHDGGAIPVDAPDLRTAFFSSLSLQATAPPHSPKINISAWDEAYFDLEGTDGGTTTVDVQYRNSSTGEWTDGITGEELTGSPRHLLDISGITGLDDTEDELRFVFSQVSDAGITEPYRVGEITVIGTQGTTHLTMYPSWGPKYGSDVAVDVKPAYRDQILLPVEDNWDAVSGTSLLYHFDELTGNVIDASGNSHDGTIPSGSASYTLQGKSGWFGYGIHTVNGQGQVDVPASEDFEASGEITISFVAKAYTSDTGVVWSHYSGGRGYDVRVNDTGQMQIYATDGGSNEVFHTHTGQPVGVNSWVMCWAKLLEGEQKLRTRVTGSDWEETTGVTFDWWTDVTGAQPTLLGGCWGSFDEFAFYSGDRDEDTWDTLEPRGVKRSTITDWEVWVDGEQVSGERLHWYHPTRVYVRMPPHDPGDVALSLDHTGQVYRPETAYTYLSAYKVDVTDELEAMQACTTKSPFRIGYTVADGDVNLAVINVPDLTVSTHMSRAPLEHLEASNIAAYNQGEFSLTSADTGETGVYYYAASVDTSDLLLSTKSVVRRDFRTPRPLYYKYLIGRGTKYVYNVDATGVDDAKLIRSAIRVENGRGDPVALEDFPWEVEVAATDINGDILPDNTYSVVMYTEIPGAINETFFVIYDGLDALREWEKKNSVKEVINPVPIFERSSDLDTVFQYDVTLDDSGVYDLRLTNG
jgi:hypothetical protein